jgi:cytochrome c
MKKLVILGVLSATVLAQSAVVKIELPQETAAYKSAPGSDLANAQCLTCHSAEYVSSQPPFPKAFWKGSVDKMIQKYGAPVPADQIDALVNYLAINYGTETAASVTNASPASSGAILDVEALAVRSGCLNCHKINEKFVGPAYKDVAAKYKDRADAREKISHQITHGGSGQWGPNAMPAFEQFKPEEVKLLADWVLGQK